MSESHPIHSASNPTLTTSTNGDRDPSLDLALTIAEAIDDRKGADIVLLRISEVSYLADYLAIATGFSRVQVRAISKAIQEKVAEAGFPDPVRVEGQADSSWVLMDYGDVLVNLLMPQEREYYDLEAFWGHAEPVEFTPSES